MFYLTNACLSREHDPTVRTTGSSLQGVDPPVKQSAVGSAAHDDLGTWTVESRGPPTGNKPDGGPRKSRVFEPGPLRRRSRTPLTVGLRDWLDIVGSGGLPTRSVIGRSTRTGRPDRSCLCVLASDGHPPSTAGQSGSCGPTVRGGRPPTAGRGRTRSRGPGWGRYCIVANVRWRRPARGRNRKRRGVSRQ